MRNPQKHGVAALPAHCWGLIALLAIAQPVSTRASEAGETTRLDCGVHALYILLHLEGRPVAFDRLKSALPPWHPDGYSMAELSRVSRSLGLDLEGVRFAKGDKALVRPAIAFIKDVKGGHFMVLRPLGTTGTMVQVIDPPNVPWITDYERLLVSRPWTGRILLPRDPWSVRYAIPLVLACLCVPLVSFSVWRRLRTFGPIETGPPRTA
jgi:Peptidase C39 family